MMNQQKHPSLLINALSSWIALFVTVVIGFFLTPFIISHLGKTGYGLWTLVGSIIGYYGLLDLGVSSAITRYVARFFGQKDYKKLNETTSTATVIFIIIGMLVVGASFVIARPLANFFNIQTNYFDEFQKVILILGICTGMEFLGHLFGAIIRAHENFVVANSISIVVTLIRTILIVLFLSHNIGLLGIAVSYLIAAVIMIILNYYFCKLLFAHFRLQLKQINLPMAKLLLGFGAATTLNSLADIMRFNLDSFVIGKWVNVPSVAVYGVAALLIRFFLQFINKGIQNVCTPRFAIIDGKGQRDQLQLLFLQSLSVAAFLSFALGTLIIVFGKEFIILWVGSDFLDSVPVLWILSLSYTIALAQNPGISLVYALKKHYFFAAASAVEGVINVALSIYLAPLFGILGVAIGTALPMLLIKLFVQPIYISRIIGISLFRYWSRLVPPLCLAIGVIMAERYFPQIIFIENGYISLAISAIPYISVFIIFYFLTELMARRKISFNLFKLS